MLFSSHDLENSAESILQEIVKTQRSKEAKSDEKSANRKILF